VFVVPKSMPIDVRSRIVGLATALVPRVAIYGLTLNGRQSTIMNDRGSGESGRLRAVRQRPLSAQPRHWCA
jgi:hypothetical protein